MQSIREHRSRERHAALWMRSDEIREQFAVHRGGNLRAAHPSAIRERRRPRPVPVIHGDAGFQNALAVNVGIAIGRKTASIQCEETSEQKERNTCDEKEDSQTAETIQAHRRREGSQAEERP